MRLIRTRREGNATARGRRAQPNGRDGATLNDGSRHGYDGATLRNQGSTRASIRAAFAATHGATNASKSRKCADARCASNAARSS